MPEDGHSPRIIPRALRVTPTVTLERAQFDSAMPMIRFVVSNSDVTTGQYYFRELKQQLAILARLHGFSLE